jgi:hypothetical protein
LRFEISLSSSRRTTAKEEPRKACWMSGSSGFNAGGLRKRFMSGMAEKARLHSGMGEEGWLAGVLKRKKIELRMPVTAFFGRYEAQWGRRRMLRLHARAAMLMRPRSTASYERGAGRTGAIVFSDMPTDSNGDLHSNRCEIPQSIGYEVEECKGADQRRSTRTGQSRVSLRSIGTMVPSLSMRANTR